MAQLQACAERTGSSFELVEADLENRAAVEATFASQAFEGRGVHAVLLRPNHHQPSVFGDRRHPMETPAPTDPASRVNR